MNKILKNHYPILSTNNLIQMNSRLINYWRLRNLNIGSRINSIMCHLIWEDFRGLWLSWFSPFWLICFMGLSRGAYLLPARFHFSFCLHCLLGLWSGLLERISNLVGSTISMLKWSFLSLVSLSSYMKPWMWMKEITSCWLVLSLQPSLSSWAFDLVFCWSFVGLALWLL